MKKSCRRIVTAQEPGGRAYIASDAPAPSVFDLPGGFRVTEVWKVAQSPIVLDCNAEEPTDGPLTLLPPAKGHLLRITDFPPDEDSMGESDIAHKVFDAMAGSNSLSNGEEASLMMHRTETLDYGIVLEGSITLVVDDDEVELSQGDVVVQRGSNHAWSNRSGKNCRMAFILIDAEYAS